MPLRNGSSRSDFEHNVKKEIEAGKPQKQALAIAYSVKRKAEDGPLEQSGAVVWKPGSAEAAANDIAYPEGHELPAFGIRNSSRPPANPPHPSNGHIQWPHNKVKDNTPTSSIYGVEQLSENQELTNDGFLICWNTPIARVGYLFYDQHELKEIEPDKHGIIRVLRTPEEVFAADAIASFNGKPVTDEHPDDLISPDTWKESKAVGVVQNPRRGTGADADVLLADLLIYDNDMIELITSKKRRELSCGYTSDYEQNAPGQATQRNILGNHVAIVKQGRCGPRCSVRDHKKMRRTFDLRGLLKRRAALDEELAEAMIARRGEGDYLSNEGPEAQEGPGALAGTHIHIHTGGGGEMKDEDKEEKKEDEENKDTDPYEARFKAIEDSLAEMKDSHKKMLDSLEDFKNGTVSAESQDKKNKDEDKEEKEDKEDEEVENKDASEVEEEEEKEEEKGKEGETKDSTSLRAAWADTISRAEKLAPGLRSLGTFDAAMQRRKTKDQLCIFRRRALAQAFQDAATETVVKKYIPNRQAVSKLPCAAVRVAFMAASDDAGALNNNRHRAHLRPTGDTPAERTSSLLKGINENSKKFWNL